MTTIRLQWNQAALDQFATELPQRFAYATANAINGTLKAIQQAEFARARSAFMIRKPGFFFGSDQRIGGIAARITTFANVKRGVAFGEITAGNDDLGRASKGGPILYAGFEDGFLRTPFTQGAKSVAVPITGGAARPSPESPIDKAFTFAGMQMRAYYKPAGGRQRKLTRQTRSRKNLGVGILGEYGQLAIPAGAEGVQWKGKSRTFIAFTEAHPRGAVFQRVGPGKDDVRIVWAFEAPFAVPARLQFVATAQRIAGEVFAEQCRIQLDEMLTHDVLKALRAQGGE